MVQGRPGEPPRADTCDNGRVTVAELTAALSKYPANTQVCIQLKRAEADDFTVEFDGEWVVLEE